MNLDWSSILAIITTVPALAWFVNAFIKIGQTYKKNEDKIKKVAKETTEDVKEGAKKLPDQIKETAKKVGEESEKVKEKAEKGAEKLKEKLYNPDPANENSDDKDSTQSGAGESS